MSELTKGLAGTALLLALGTGCAQSQPDCGMPGLCSWNQLSGMALTIGEVATLQVSFDLSKIPEPATPGLVTSGHVPVQLRLGRPDVPSLSLALPFNQKSADPVTKFAIYEYTLAKDALNPPDPPSWFGMAQLTVDSSRGDNYVPQAFNIEIKKPIKIGSLPIIYTDIDKDPPQAAPGTFPFPIRILPSKWKNPTTGSDETIVISLHRGNSGGDAKRKIKVLQYGDSKLWFDGSRKTTAYESVLDYAALAPNDSWGEVLPTPIRSANTLLFGFQYINPNYGVRECDNNETNISSCPERIETSMVPNLLSADTRALVGLDIAGSSLLARADGTGKVYTLLLPMTQTIQAQNWQPVPNTTPHDVNGQRVFLSLGTLINSTAQSLLVTYQDPKTRLLTAIDLYPLTASGTPSTVQSSNLSTLLAGQPVEALGVGDIDQDQRMDIVYAANGVLHFLVNTGSGQFRRDTLTIPLPSMRAVSSIALGDMDGDNRLDVLVAQELDKRVLIYLNQY